MTQERMEKLMNEQNRKNSAWTKFTRWPRLRDNTQETNGRNDMHASKDGHQTVEYRHSETNRNFPYSQKDQDTSTSKFKKNAALQNKKPNSDARIYTENINKEIPNQRVTMYGRSGHDDDKRDDCTYIMKNTDSTNIDSRSHFGQLTTKHARSKIHSLFERDGGPRIRKLSPQTLWGAKSVPKCSKHFRNGWDSHSAREPMHFFSRPQCKIEIPPFDDTQHTTQGYSSRRKKK